jgi:hypothetical protein
MVFSLLRIQNSEDAGTQGTENFFRSGFDVLRTAPHGIAAVPGRRAASKKPREMFDRRTGAW